MATADSKNANPFLFTLIPVLPSFFFGLILLWQQGISLTSISFAFLMVLFSLVCSYFIWVWHADDLQKLKSHHQKKYKEGLYMLTSYATELERLLLTVEPKLAEQILAAKELTEQETAMLITRFTAMTQELKAISDLAGQAAAVKPENTEAEPLNLDGLKLSAEKLRKEIDVILESLQFQDRVSQILALVRGNLAAVRETVEQIQQQGADRHKKMLNVEEMAHQIQTQYESVKQRGGKSSAKAKKAQADDLTFF